MINSPLRLDPDRGTKIAAARHRLESGVYDRPEVIAAAAGALLASGDLVTRIAQGMEEDAERWDGMS